MVYRINTILLGLLFLFLAAKGGIQGNKLLWMFSFPLIALYTLGIPEGLVWIVIVWVLNLVILDMIMEPGIDGLETYTRMQAFRPGLKTLLVSGFSETGQVKEAQLLGAGAYLKKPFGIEILGLAVRKELNRISA